MNIVVVAPESCFFEGSVHPLNLPNCPRNGAAWTGGDPYNSRKRRVVKNERGKSRLPAIASLIKGSAELMLSGLVKLAPFLVPWP
jgi:hypothetical protein